MRLSDDDFKFVCKNTPLVALDFICLDPQGRVLLGRRRSSPARGSWFVPGGRIMKNETLPSALHRISIAELGIPINMGDVSLRGIYEHIYKENHFDEPYWGTHYISIALDLHHWLTLSPPRGQHDEYEYIKPEKLRDTKDVHPYVLMYFEDSPGLKSILP